MVDVLKGAVLLRAVDGTMYVIPDEVLCRFKMPDHEQIGSTKGDLLQTLLDDLPNLLNIRNALRLELTFEEPPSDNKSGKDADMRLEGLLAAITEITRHGPRSPNKNDSC